MKRLTAHVLTSGLRAAYAAILTSGLCAALSSAAYADTNETVNVDAIINEVVTVIEDEGWTATDVADAIRSLRGLYLRDNATKEGRARWHGKVISTSVDTNTLTRTTIHEDGEVFTDPAKVITPAQSVQAANKRLPPPVMTNGIPTRLANARLRQRENSSTTNVVSVSIRGGDSM